jgi:hypothetical protein
MATQTNSTARETSLEMRALATNSAEICASADAAGAQRMEEAADALSTTVFMLGCALGTLLMVSSTVSAATPQIVSLGNRYTANRLAMGSTSSGLSLAIEAEPLSTELETSALLNTKFKNKAKTLDSVTSDYNWLASNAPETLLTIIRDGQLRPSRLTFAAEAAGLIPNSVAVRDALFPLLQHESAVVREGAIYGISNHLNDEALIVLRRIATDDASPAVRQAAADLLDE